MRITIITSVDYPLQDSYDFANPIDQQAYWLIKHLQEKHETQAVCQIDSSPAIKNKMEQNTNDEKKAWELYQKDIGWKKEVEGTPPKEPATVAPAKKETIQEMPDIVIDFSEQKWSWHIAKEKKVPVLFVNHPFQVYKSPPPLPYNCMTGVSDAHCTALSRDLGIPVKKLPFGVELPENLPKREDKGYLLYFGSIIRERGVHEALDLAKRRRIPLLIAGDDRNVEQKYVHEILKKCDGEMIRYFGAVGENVKLKLMAEAHCLIIPYLSDEEAYCCMTMKTASSMGVPTVALSRGSVREFWDKNVFAFPSLESMHACDYIGMVGTPVPWKPAYDRLDELIEMAIKEPW